MADTNIEWCDSVWNPVRGCTRVSEGCRNCYAERQAHRFSGPGMPYEGLTVLANGHPQWTGKITLAYNKLNEPFGMNPVRLHTKQCAGGSKCVCPWRSRRIFVNSMSDLFHEGVPEEFINRVFGTMANSRKHIFQILTKRPTRMLEFMRQRKLVPPNVWLGVSVENQKTADERIPLLLQTPAAVRFISAEPLLDSLTLNPWLLRETGLRLIGAPTGIAWVIVGGESGPGARGCSKDWVRDIVKECSHANVPVFVKQLGSNSGLRSRKGGDMTEWPEDLRVREFPEERQ